MSRIAQPAFAQPLSELSLNRSNRHRIHAIRAAIQMKNQKLHKRTSPKSVVIASMVIPSRDRPTRRDERWPQPPRREGSGSGWGRRVGDRHLVAAKTDDCTKSEGALPSGFIRGGGSSDL